MSPGPQVKAHLGSLQSCMHAHTDLSYLIVVKRSKAQKWKRQSAPPLAAHTPPLITHSQTHPPETTTPLDTRCIIWHPDRGLICSGSVGLGHVRYPTAGTSSVQEAQPFFVNSPLGMYLIHNGNITNTDELKVLLNSKASFFNRYLRTDSDSEVTIDTWGVTRTMSRCSFA